MYDMARAQSISDRTNYRRNRVAASIRCRIARFTDCFRNERMVHMNNAPEFISGDGYLSSRTSAPTAKSRRHVPPQH